MNSYDLEIWYAQMRKLIKYFIKQPFWKYVQLSDLELGYVTVVLNTGKYADLPWRMEINMMKPIFEQVKKSASKTEKKYREIKEQKEK